MAQNTAADVAETAARPVGQADSSTSTSTRVAELKHAIAEAVSRKDYAASMALAQDLEAAKQADQRHLELEQAVEAAVAQEDFALVAKLSAELKSLEEATPSAGSVGLAC